MQHMCGIDERMIPGRLPRPGLFQYVDSCVGSLTTGEGIATSRNEGGVKSVRRETWGLIRRGHFRLSTDCPYLRTTARWGAFRIGIFKRRTYSIDCDWSAHMWDIAD
jgi:hypothetical protein